jgi:hypothetical protein
VMVHLPPFRIRISLEDAAGSNCESHRLSA